MADYCCRSQLARARTTAGMSACLARTSATRPSSSTTPKYPSATAPTSTMRTTTFLLRVGIHRVHQSHPALGGRRACDIRKGMSRKNPHTDDTTRLATAGVASKKEMLPHRFRFSVAVGPASLADPLRYSSSVSVPSLVWLVPPLSARSSRPQPEGWQPSR
jgi:hypothetical protein